MAQPKVLIELRRSSNFSERYQLVKLTGAITIQSEPGRPFHVGSWITPEDANDLLCVENYVVTVKIK